MIDGGYSAWWGARAIDRIRKDPDSTCYKISKHMGKFKYGSLSNVIDAIPTEENGANLMEELFFVTSAVTKLDMRSKNKASNALDSLLENVKNIVGKTYTTSKFDNVYSKYKGANIDVSREFPDIKGDISAIDLRGDRFLYDFAYLTANMGDAILEERKNINTDTVVYISTGGLEAGALAAYVLDAKLVPIEYHTAFTSVTSNKKVPVYDPILLGSDRDIKGKDVIVVDDAIETGYTLSGVLDNIKKMEPHSLSVAVPISTSIPDDNYYINYNTFFGSSKFVGEGSRGVYSPLIFKVDLS